MSGQELPPSFWQTAFDNMPEGKHNVMSPVDIAELGVNVIVTVAVLENTRSALAMVIENCDTEVAET